MKIAAIRWLDAAADEAEVMVISESKKGLACWAYCHPCELQSGAPLTAPLSSLDTRVVTTSNKTPKIEKNGKQPWSYVIVGELVDRSRGVVVVEDIRVEIGSYALPGDVGAGDWLECVCSRLEV